MFQWVYTNEWGSFPNRTVVDNEHKTLPVNYTFNPLLDEIWKLGLKINFWFNYNETLTAEFPDLRLIVNS